MSMNDKLAAVIQRSYDDEQNYLASMTDEERKAAGILSKWSPKDNLAHVAAWKLYMADWLAGNDSYTVSRDNSGAGGSFQ